jgi:hypothetical protein
LAGHYNPAREIFSALDKQVPPMKPAFRIVQWTCVGALLLSYAANSPSTFAAAFTNLNFEQAVVVVNDPMFGHLDWSVALPGWIPPSGNPNTATVFYGHGHFGTGSLMMLVDGIPPQVQPGPTIAPLAGDYSLSVRGSYFADEGDAWISQTGDVPASARAIELIVSGDAPVISLDGSMIPLAAVGQVGGATRYAGNATSFAGINALLKINFPATTWTQETWEEEAFIASGGSNSGIIDDIQFTTRIIPEPSACALSAVALAGLLAFRRWK